MVLIEVEVARTEQQRATGLMNRKVLPSARGCCSISAPTDGLYVDEEHLHPPGHAVSSAPTAPSPGSRRTHAVFRADHFSGEPVRAVIEIGGGEARKLGITSGDKVSNTLFRGR